MSERNSKYYPLCVYCNEKHATDVICQRMFQAHAEPFKRLCQENPAYKLPYIKRYGENDVFPWREDD